MGSSHRGVEGRPVVCYCTDTAPPRRTVYDDDTTTRPRDGQQALRSAPSPSKQLFAVQAVLRRRVSWWCFGGTLGIGEQALIASLTATWTCLLPLLRTTTPAEPALLGHL